MVKGLLNKLTSPFVRAGLSLGLATTLAFSGIGCSGGSSLSKDELKKISEAVEEKDIRENGEIEEYEIDYEKLTNLEYWISASGLNPRQWGKSDGSAIGCTLPFELYDVDKNPKEVSERFTSLKMHPSDIEKVREYLIVPNCDEKNKIITMYLLVDEDFMKESGKMRCFYGVLTNTNRRNLYDKSDKYKNPWVRAEFICKELATGKYSLYQTSPKFKEVKKGVYAAKISFKANPSNEESILIFETRHEILAMVQPRFLRH